MAGLLLPGTVLEARRPVFLCVCMSFVTCFRPDVMAAPRLMSLNSAALCCSLGSGPADTGAGLGGGGGGGGGPPGPLGAASPPATEAASAPRMFQLRPVVWCCLTYACSALSASDQARVNAWCALFSLMTRLPQKRPASFISLMSGPGAGAVTTQERAAIDSETVDRWLYCGERRLASRNCVICPMMSA